MIDLFLNLYIYCVCARVCLPACMHGHIYVGARGIMTSITSSGTIGAGNLGPLHEQYVLLTALLYYLSNPEADVKCLRLA